MKKLSRQTNSASVSRCPSVIHLAEQCTIPLLRRGQSQSQYQAIIGGTQSSKPHSHKGMHQNDLAVRLSNKAHTDCGKKRASARARRGRTKDSPYVRRGSVVRHTCYRQGRLRSMRLAAPSFKSTQLSALDFQNISKFRRVIQPDLPPSDHKEHRASRPTKNLSVHHTYDRGNTSLSYRSVSRANSAGRRCL